MGAWHYCLLHMVVVVPNSPWWRPDTAVCYTRGCGCPWLTLMKAWHCCLLHTWLLLSLTHLDGGVTLLFVTHMVVVVPNSPWWRPDTAVCYTGGCPWLTLIGAWHYCLLYMVVVVPNSPWWRPDTAVCYTGGCLWLTLMKAWHCCLLHRWLSLTHLDGCLALLFVTHGCGCPWLTLMEAWHCCLLHTWLWLSLTHLDGGLTLLFVTHVVVVVPDSPWWRPDTAVCYTRGCGCP